MASLKDIRKRIGSVKNTQKITRAMKLVAAAKLRRSQDAIIAQRPYAKELMKVIAELATRTDRAAHPLLEERDGPRALVIVLTSDRGLAGAFNSQICRATERWMKGPGGEEFPDHQLWLVGRKGGDYFRRRNAPTYKRQLAPTPANTLTVAREISNEVVEQFVDNQFDRVFVVYNEFKSAISQEVVVEQLLPVVPAELPAGTPMTDFVYEPSKDALLDHLLPLYVQIELYRAHLESVASEFGARMSAMDAATRNASEMIGKLTLQYNRARQAAITKELLEIIGGAEALKG